MKRRILVVDDNRMNLLIAKRLLSASYDIDISSSGMEALTYLETTIPDLILLDVMMPEMDGLEVIKKLKQHDVYAKIPVIFLTADEFEGTQRACLEYGAVDFVVKPLVPTVMLEKIRNALGKVKNCFEENT